MGYIWGPALCYVSRQRPSQVTSPRKSHRTEANVDDNVDVDNVNNVDNVDNI